MVGESVAKRYVRALFEVTEEQQVSDDVVDALQELEALYTSLPEFRNALGNPRIPPATKRDILLRVVGEDAPEAVRAFAGLLVDKSRVDVLRRCGRLFQGLLDTARGVRHAVVTTALPLADDQERQMASVLSRALGCEVLVNNRVDPSLVGGVAVRVGDMLLDGSLHQRLASLRQHLARERELGSRQASG